MPRPLRSILLAAATLVAIGCSDDTLAPPPGDTRPSGDAPVAGGDARVEARPPLVDGPTAGGPCPASLPEANTACTRPGLTCEYGDNPRCRPYALCDGGKWGVTTPKCLPPDPGCPATREAAAGQVCSTENAYCVYSGLTCDCTNCIKYPVSSCSGPLKWSCEAPSSDASCPQARPPLGAVCTVEGKLCAYGCETDVSRKCSGGVWVKASAPGGCPISTRRAKRDVCYLDEAARERVADEAARLRLATYRYRDAALGERTHLGFILEDHPRSLASDLERQQVDLYSFASMTLALAQRQQKQIDALRAEVAALKVRLKGNAR